MKFGVFRYVLLVFIFAGTFGFLHAQDIHHVQFTATPLATNPAFTGMFDGSARATYLYRNEWDYGYDYYITHAVSFDMPVLFNKKGDYLAAGAQIIRDFGDDRGSFTGVFSLGYHKYFGADNAGSDNYTCDLGVGIQAEYVQKDIDVANMFYRDGQRYIDPFYSGSYGFGGVAEHYGALNAGLCFSQKIGKVFDYTIGFSGNNLNLRDDPKTYRHEIVRTDRIYSAEMGADWMPGRLSVHPAVYYSSSDIQERMIAGSEFRYVLRKRKDGKAMSVFAGVWDRTGDVISLTSGIEIRRFRVGVGYDTRFTLGEDTYNNNGALEVSVRYIAKGARSLARRAHIPFGRF